MNPVNQTDAAHVIQKSGLPLPPRAGYTYEYAVTATSVRTAVPAAWLNKIVSLRAETADVYILFGDNTVAADDTAAAGATGCCQVLPTGQSADWYVPTFTDCAYFAVKTSSGTAKLRAHVSSL